MLATLAMDTFMKIKWFEKWNTSPALHEALKFSNPKFNDIEFSKWVHKATWWPQVINFFYLLFFVH